MFYAVGYLSGATTIVLGPPAAHPRARAENQEPQNCVRKGPWRALRPRRQTNRFGKRARTPTRDCSIPRQDTAPTSPRGGPAAGKIPRCARNDTVRGGAAAAAQRGPPECRGGLALRSVEATAGIEPASGGFADRCITTLLRRQRGAHCSTEPRGAQGSCFLVDWAEIFGFEVRYFGAVVGDLFYAALMLGGLRALLHNGSL